MGQKLSSNTYFKQTEVEKNRIISYNIKNLKTKELWSLQEYLQLSPSTLHARWLLYRLTFPINHPLRTLNIYCTSNAYNNVLNTLPCVILLPSIKFS